MGKELGRSHTSISDEIKRNSGNREYSPHIAEILYKQRLSLTGSKYKLSHDTELKEYIELKIKKDDWLPDEVVGRSKLEGYQTISISTIYRGIANDLLDIDEKQHLKFKGERKAKNSKDQRGTIPDRKFI
jgi:IS30 family transposase